ncbi:hypothetical protein Hanom_Chr09g00759661 [Helianthus anomalus]
MVVLGRWFMVVMCTKVVDLVSWTGFDRGGARAVRWEWWWLMVVVANGGGGRWLKWWREFL